LKVKAKGGLTVKRIEKKVQQAEERYKKSLATTPGPGISFEDTGIDYLIVDEAHMCKNLATVRASMTPGSRAASRPTMCT